MTNSKWLAPRDITFSKDQMVDFLLPNLSMLRHGEWPPEEVETGYSGIDAEAIRRKHSASTAYFTLACGIAAEVGARLNKCGKYDRIIYVLNCEIGGNPEKLAREFNMHIDDFNILWDKLLIYISGWKRKRMTFKRWVNLSIGGALNDTNPN
jgi:hypothetical protein